MMPDHRQWNKEGLPPFKPLQQNGEPKAGSPFCYFVVVFEIQAVYFG